MDAFDGVIRSRTIAPVRLVRAALGLGLRQEVQPLVDRGPVGRIIGGW